MRGNFPLKEVTSVGQLTPHGVTCERLLPLFAIICERVLPFLVTDYERLVPTQEDDLRDVTSPLTEVT